MPTWMVDFHCKHGACTSSLMTYYLRYTGGVYITTCDVLGWYKPWAEYGWILPEWLAMMYIIETVLGIGLEMVMQTSPHVYA